MRHRVHWSAISLLLASLAVAQQPPNPQSSLPHFTSRSDLVLVPVLVTDKSGNPVLGLTKEAFHLEENGKPRTLSVFEETQTEKLSTLSKSSSPATYSNFPAQDNRSSRLTIVLLDLLHTASLRQIEAKKQLTDYLLHLASRDEPMALFGLNASGLHQLQRDTQVLVLALQKLKVSLSSEESTQPPPTLTEDPAFASQITDEEQQLADMLQDLDDTISANYQRMATRQALLAMTQLSLALGSFPVRKTLLWATAGFPFTIDDRQSFARQGDDLRPEYEEAWRALSSANIAVYPVDLGSADFTPKALPSGNSTVSKSQINTIRGTNGLRSPTNLPYDEGVQQRLAMHAFADATGGRACVTISELEKCFAEAVDDSRSYYLLGYYLGDDTQPGWRKLKVKVSRDSLHVRSRTGFYVSPKFPDTPEQRRKELVDALASPVQYTGLRLTARVQPLENNSTTASANTEATSSASQTKPAKFMLGVMGDTLIVDREKGNGVDFQISTIAFDSKRKAIDSKSQSLVTSLKPGLLQKILQTGMGIPEELDLAPGTYEIKFAVRDNLSGLIGTVSLPLELN